MGGAAWDALCDALRGASQRVLGPGVPDSPRDRAEDRDPGVPNWLDAAGTSPGTIASRFLLATAAPVPRLRRVPFERLRGELPADTPRVDPATRAATLWARRRAVQTCDRR